MQFIRIIILSFACSLLISCKTTNPLDAYQKFSDKQIYESAEQNMKRHRYEQATKDFEALDAIYPFGDYSQQAQLDIITAYYKNEDAESALAAADRYIRLYPRANNVDYAYYMKGVINQGPKENWFFAWIHAKPEKRDISSQKEAFEDFTILLERFPNSQYAPDARHRMTEIHYLLAQHELEIAQYYLRRKTYVAAANRAVDLMNDYQGMPQIPAALEVMIKSYKALGENNMAESALRLLTNRYPASQEAKMMRSMR